MSKKCPRCLSLDNRRSQRRNIFERLLGLFGWIPYRCNACGKRFFSPNKTGKMQRHV